MPRYSLEDQIEDYGGVVVNCPAKAEYYRMKDSDNRADIYWSATRSNLNVSGDTMFGTYILPEESRSVNPVAFRTQWEQSMLAKNKTLMESYASNTERTCVGYLPKMAPFTGQKTIKPLYFCFDPAYNGDAVMPYTVLFKFHYSHTISVFRKTPAVQMPDLEGTGAVIDNSIWKYSGYVMTVPSYQLNPYSTAGAEMAINNVYIRQFVPTYYTMFASLKKALTGDKRKREDE